MVSIDPEPTELISAAAIVPLSLISIIFIGFQDFISAYYYYFYSAAIVVSLVISIFTVRKIIQKNYLLLIPGILLFTFAFSVFLISILNVLAEDYFDISLVVFMIIITSFLLLFPLVEWFTLTKKGKKDAVLPLQNKIEAFLEKITRGKRIYSLIPYILIYAILIPVFYVITKQIVITLILSAFLLPLINLGYITGLNVGDELLWFKYYRNQIKDPKKKLKFQLIGVNWEKRTLGMYRVSLGHTLASLLAVVLVGMSFYGIGRNINIIITGSTFIGIGVYITLSKSLVLSGRNAVSQTKRIWKATVIKDKPNNVDLFYPIYIGVTILSIIALQILAKFSDRIIILSNNLGIEQNRGLIFGFLLIETFVFLIAVVVVLVKHKDPIQVREFKEEEFENLSPVEKLFAIEKLYKNVLTHASSKQQEKTLEKAIAVGTNKINSIEILPFLTSPEIKLRSVAMVELRRLLESDKNIVNEYLQLLKKGKLESEIQRLLVRELTYVDYVPELRKLALNKKISANWIVRSLRGNYQGSSAITSDNEKLFVASQSKILVWTKIDHQYIKTLEEHQGPIKALYCDDYYLYSGGCDNTVILWDKEKLEKVASLKGHKKDIYSIFSDDRFIYSGSADSSLKIWKIDDFSLYKTIEINKGCINCIRGTDKLLFAGVEDSNIYVWSKDNFGLVNTLSEHTGKVWTLYVDDKYLYSGSQDSSIIVWDLKKLKPKAYLEGMQGSSIFAICGDEDFIYSSSYDRTVSVINKKDFTLFAKVDVLSSAARAIHVDAGNLYTTTYSQLVLIWDKDTISLIEPIKAHESRVNSLHNDRKYIYSASDDRTIKVWKMKRRGFKFIASLEEHTSAVVDLAGDKSHLYSVSRDKTIRKWQKKSLTLVETINAHKKRIHAIRLLNDKIYTCSADETIAIWDKTTLEKISEIKIEGVGIKSLDVDSQYIYAGGDNQILYIYAISNLNQICYLQQEEDDIKSIHATRDYIYVGHVNGKILKWDKEDLSFEKQLGYHYESVNSIVDDRKYLYTCSNDNSIKIWSKEQERYLTSIYQHASWVNCLSIGKKYVFSGSSDRSIKRIRKFPEKSVLKVLIPYFSIILVLITAFLLFFFLFQK